jgi:hypothetical protein
LESFLGLRRFGFGYLLQDSCLAFGRQRDPFSACGKRWAITVLPIAAGANHQMHLPFHLCHHSMDGLFLAAAANGIDLIAHCLHLPLMSFYPVSQ